MKQAEKKSKSKAKTKTVLLSKAEYEAVKQSVSAKEKQRNAVKLPQTAQQSIPFDYMTKDGIAVASEPENLASPQILCKSKSNNAKDGLQGKRD